MVDVLRIGATSLINLQQAISTTGHNISNVNTDGYSRQTVHFGTNPSQDMGFGFVGQGSTILSIERSYNDFVSAQVQNFTSSQSRYQAFVDYSSRVDNLLANSQTSLSTSIQKFFGAFSDVAANPSSLPERQVLIGEAGNLQDRILSLNNSFQSMHDEVNSALRISVSEINSLADNISELNRQIASTSGTGDSPNDLLDQRDRLVRDLSQKISVSTVEQENGALNIYIGQGQTLVVGQDVTHLTVGTNGTDSRLLEVGIEGQLTSSGSSKFISGGELQGLLEFRSRVLLPAESQLGLIALGLAETINAQHSAGMDLNGDLGSNLFQAISIPVADDSFNTGNAVPAVTIADVTEVRASDYELNYDGATWHLTRLSDNTTVSGAGPLVLDGMSVDLSVGSAVAGDKFVFNAARSAATNFRLAITDPRKIAAAMPVAGDTDINNAGSAIFSELAVDPANTSGLPLPSAITLTFDPDALGAGVPGFLVSGGPGGIPTLAYDPLSESAGKSFVLGSTGISVTISDVPLAGDSFTIANNTGATGDNRNALLIGELQNKSLLNGNSDTYQELYGSMVAQVGVATSQGAANLNLESSLLQQAENYKDSVSGVNLDEEAANLLRYQQAYQASAQLIKVSEEMFQTLINSFG